MTSGMLADMSLDPKSPSMKLWHRLLAAGATEEEATELMHGYAHELAERIRNTPGHNDPDDYGGFTDAGADWAANLIDPRAEEYPVDAYRLSTRPGVVGGGA